MLLDIVLDDTLLDVTDLDLDVAHDKCLLHSSDPSSLASGVGDQGRGDVGS